MKRSISVEVFRDRQTPDVSLDQAIEGLEQMRQIIPSLEIVALGNFVKLSRRKHDYIRTDKLPELDMHTDFGIILTGQSIIMPVGRQMPIHQGNITVGLTHHPLNGKDYSLIDASQSLSVKNSTMHEAGHLFGIPNGGESFDGRCHCRLPDCLMHGELRSEQTTYCSNCTIQLARSVANLLAN